MAVFKRKCAGYEVKIHEVDHAPPHCHIAIRGRDKKVCLMTLAILNPPPHALPPALRSALASCQDEMLRAWDDVTIWPD